MVSKVNPKVRIRIRPRPQRDSVIQLPLDMVTRDTIRAYNPPFSAGYQFSSMVSLRRMAQTNPIIRSYLQLAKNGVVGAQPIRPSFATVRSERDRKALEKLWAEFERAPTSDGRISMRQYQRGLVEQYIVDGRVFGLLKYSRQYPLGIAITTLPRECLAYTQVNTDKMISWGMKYNKEGRLIAYLVYKNYMERAILAQRFFGEASVSYGEPIEVPPERMLDCRNLSRADAWGGYESRLASAANGLMGVDEIDKATIKTMKAASCKMGFLERDLGSPGAEIDGTDAPETQEADIPDRMGYGSIDELPPGWRFSGFDPNWPNVNGTDYRTQILRAVIASMGSDYNSVCVDGVGVNYNSLRHFSLQVRDTWREVQGDVVDCVMRPLLERFIDHQQAVGNLRLSVASVDEVKQTRFQTRAYPWVDPLKDSKAKIDQLLTGTISPQDIAAESGRELTDVYNDFAEAAALVDKIGADKIKLILQMFGGKGGGGGNTPPEEGEKKEQQDEEK